MNDQTYFLDIILFAAITIFLVYRLKSVLGKKHGEERDRNNPYVKKEETPLKEPVPLVKSTAAKQKFIRPQTTYADDMPLTLSQGIARIQEADPSFDEKKFVKGARRAFEMIIEAFANHDHDFLKKLLSHSVYEQFAKLMDDRSTKGQRYQADITRLDDIAILKANLEGKKAVVTMTITSHQKIALFDKKGELIEGNPDKAQEVVDRWTFSRDTTSDNPNWTLIRTASAAE